MLPSYSIARTLHAQLNRPRQQHKALDGVIDIIYFMDEQHGQRVFQLNAALVQRLL